MPMTAGAVRTDDDAAFNAAVAALASTFGDPTRRAIYLYLRTHPGATARDVAVAQAVHPNVARHHLDRLVAAGHVVASTTPRGVGRPAKAYSVTDDSLADAGATRRDELLVALLERALELLGPELAERMALEVGETYGRGLASEVAAGDGQRTVRGAMTAVATALTAHGFAARAEVHGDNHSVVADACPFGEAASHHPVLCAVDRGLVHGMLDGLGAGATAPVTLSSRARGDDACRASA
jgi:predicted ArsR family transcriptional regulator